MSNELKKVSKKIIDNDGHCTYLHIQECLSPKDAIYVSFTTKFSRAISPEDHNEKYAVVLKNRDELKEFSKFLADF